MLLQTKKIPLRIDHYYSLNGISYILPHLINTHHKLLKVNIKLNFQLIASENSTGCVFACIGRALEWHSKDQEYDHLRFNPKSIENSLFSMLFLFLFNFSVFKSFIFIIIDFIVIINFSDNFAGSAHCNNVCRNILCNNAACADYGVFSNGYTRQNDNSRSEPYTFFIVTGAQYISP